MLPVRVGGGRRRVHYYPGHNIKTSKKWRRVWEIVNQPQEERDLSGKNLSGADLFRADLSEARLWKANLSGAKLYRANLSGADVCWANLSKALLYDANLSGAKLWRANLSGADLRGADLSAATLEGAEVTNEQLTQTRSLEGTTMPDGTVHEWHTIHWTESDALGGPGASLSVCVDVTIAHS